MTSVRLRPASSEDLPAIRTIVDLEEGAPDPTADGFPEAVDAYYLHLLARGAVLLAEADEGVVGFGATIESGRGVHLADLFVAPAWQGRGIGRRLLPELFGDRWPRTTFSSDDPRALPLYVRMGMRPFWPNLYLMGDAGRLPVVDGSLVVASASAAEVAALERDWWGVDRLPEHGFWASEPEARPLVVRSADGEALAAGYSRARLRGGGRWMSQLFIAPGAEPLAPTIAALRWSADATGRIGACLLGPHPAIPALFAAGFRVIDRDTYQASDPSLIDPERLIVNTGIL